MDLTTEQKAALVTYIEANPDTNQLFVDGNTSGLADLLNTDFDPPFTVWRTSVTQDEVMLNGFDWARVDNLSVGKARIWEWLFDNAQNAINPSKTNIRNGIDAAWTGTQADLNVRAAVYVHCKRLASRVEKVFASGTGSDAVPATLVIEGPIDASDVQGL
jgi:hypothetical protein